MAVNELTVEQASTVLNSVVSQATGNSNISALNGAYFATVAQVGLKAGYDPMLNAIVGGVIAFITACPAIKGADTPH